jgi:hypothetical protein
MVCVSLVPRALAVGDFRSCVMPTPRAGGAMHWAAQDGKRYAA